MAVLWISAGAITLVSVGLLWRRVRTPDRRDRPVLPARYYSYMYADPTRYPGLCSACGTENTPGYNFCKECGERLPGGTHTRSDIDISQIFRE